MSFYLLRCGRPLTNRDGSVRIFANGNEMGRLQRGDQPMIWRGVLPGVDQGAASIGRPGT